MSPTDFCPFEVPAPNLHRVKASYFSPGESRSWTIFTLKSRMLELANLYLWSSQESARLRGSESIQLIASGEAGLSDFLRIFAEVTDSDRFQTVALTRYGSGLTVKLLTRILADLVKESKGQLTYATAEQLTLGEVANALETPLPRMEELPAVDDVTPEKAKGKDGANLTPSEAEALHSEKLAHAISREDGSLSSDATDEEVYNWLNDHHDDERVKPVLPISLPAFKQALRRARNRLNTRKRRRAAATGKSVVRKADLESMSRGED